MKTFLATLSLLGSALADTANIVAAPSQPAQVQENLYYNNYAEDPYSQGYYDYSNDQAVFAAEDSPTDRQDFFDAITPLTVGTVFVAALLGAMVAPALSSATRSLMDFAFEIPNIEISLPGAEEEVNEVRSLGGGEDWSRLLTNVATNLAQEFSSKYKGRFQKLLNSKNL